MTSTSWPRVRELFEAALERPDAERGAFLDAACGNQPALRAELASLLDAHAGADDFIEAPAYQTHADLLDQDERPETLAGQPLGPYLVRHEIGRGGMGVVYLADDTRLSRRVALKALFPQAQSDAASQARIRLEARAAAALSHPGIATVYALEEIDGGLFVAFEYVPGSTLRTLIEAGPLPLQQVVDVSAQLAHALAAAHAQGIVHRDLKPENVVRTAAGVVKILDFGIARFEHASGPRLTRAGAAIGTPAYMSPEQIRGDEVDFRGDLFSLGLLICEMATASRTFDVDTPPPTGAPALDRIVTRCLRQRPADRYASTHALVADLDGLRASLSGTGAPAVRPGGLTPRWWWEIHQLVTSVVYALMLYPAWRARGWLPVPLGRVFFFAMLALAAAAASVRLHLWFTSRFNVSELDAQRSRLFYWTRATDVGLAITLFLAGIGISENHPEIAALLVAVAIVATAASFVIEPATTAAAFRDRSRG